MKVVRFLMEAATAAFLALPVRLMGVLGMLQRKAICVGVKLKVLSITLCHLYLFDRCLKILYPYQNQKT